MSNQQLSHLELTPYQSEAIAYFLANLTFSDIEKRVSPTFDPYEVQAALKTLSTHL